LAYRPRARISNQGRSCTQALLLYEYYNHDLLVGTRKRNSQSNAPGARRSPKYVPA
jgi:hypothetical protein